MEPSWNLHEVKRKTTHHRLVHATARCLLRVDVLLTSRAIFGLGHRNGDCIDQVYAVCYAGARCVGARTEMPRCEHITGIRSLVRRCAVEPSELTKQDRVMEVLAVVGMSAVTRSGSVGTLVGTLEDGKCESMNERVHQSAYIVLLVAPYDGAVYHS